jgi:hypothetical protein
MRPEPFAIGRRFGKRVVIECFSGPRGEHKYRVRCDAPCNREAVVGHAGLRVSTMCRECAKGHNRRREHLANRAAFTEPPVVIDQQKVMREALDAALCAELRARMERR